MPWLPFYCTQDDVPCLMKMIEGDLAFIVPDGKHRWRAVKKAEPTSDVFWQVTLWHIPSGPLPHGDAKSESLGLLIDDPWLGWDDVRTFMTPTEPQIGGGQLGVFSLHLRIRGHDEGSLCGLSSFQWIGNHFSSLGRTAPEVTAKRWAKLRRQIAKVSKKLPRGGPDGDGPAEIWAMPNATKILGKADLNL